jgi:hypothetical protein
MDKELRSLMLLLAQAASLGAWVAFTRWEVRQNARLIRADGPRDSLHAAFHRQRTLLRLGVALALAGAGALPLLGTGYPLLLGGLALLLGCGAYFAWAFTPQLNVARGLPRYYVSFAPQAAHFPDRLLAARAARRYPADAAAQRTWAAAALRRLLLAVLASGAAAYLGLLAATWLAT